MVMAQPHFLLFCDTHVPPRAEQAASDEGAYAAPSLGRWHFVLEQLDGPNRFEATDSEGSVHRDRLALLSVVRGLEALEQPSHVTLVTTSRYVSRGLRYGLMTWREADYTWERFGVQKPIRNADLWQRIDSALQFHGVTCRLIQSSLATAAPQPTTHLSPQAGAAVAHHSRPTWENKIARERCENGARYAGQRRVTTESHFGFPSLQHSAATWWQLAVSWIRWWRGRMQSNPAFSGA